MTISQYQLCTRLRSLGLSQEETHALMDEFQKWVSCSGATWTVNRLKAYKQLYINRLAGKGYQPIPGQWIDWDKFRGKPSGSFGVVFSRFPDNQMGHMRALSILNVYTSLVSEDITLGQWNKFHGSVTKPDLDDGSVRPQVRSLLPSSWRFNKLHPEMSAFVDLKRMSSSKSTWDGQRSVSEDNMVVWSKWQVLNTLVRDRMDDHDLVPPNSKLGNTIRLAYSSHRLVQEPYDKVSLRGGGFHMVPDSMIPRVPFVGTIGFIQEPGYKLRAVANPNRFVQAMLEPLKRELHTKLARYEQDCTTDQTKAIPVIQQWLEEGNEVSSVDLSDATNNFPLRYTMELLREVVTPGNLARLTLFEEASRSEWIIPPRIRTQLAKLGVDAPPSIRWTVGQPLGLGPSFSAFALSHHALVRSLGIRDYFILGDDVVFKKPEDADKYREALTKLDCPVSEVKTIRSSKVAEFAGYLITKNFAIQPLKWKGTSDVNFVSQARALGKYAPLLFRRRQRAILEEIKEIPEKWGGLGFNPKGLTLEERFQKHQTTILKIYSPDTDILTDQAHDAAFARMTLSGTPAERLAPTGIGPEDQWSARPPSVLTARQQKTLHRLLVEKTMIRDEVFFAGEDTTGLEPVSPSNDPRHGLPSTLANLERKLSSEVKINWDFLALEESARKNRKPKV